MIRKGCGEKAISVYIDYMLRAHSIIDVAQHTSFLRYLDTKVLDDLTKRRFNH